jgi:alpha-L-rhamnosidase
VVYEPRSTFQGFRYAAVEGYPGELTLDSLTAVVVHSDMAVTGHFGTSSPMLDQLQHNTVWGQKGNFLDVPTDCPQRDERLGWTGDAQVFARTAAVNMDVAAFLEKRLRDVAADQNGQGGVPHVVPDVLKQGATTIWERWTGWVAGARQDGSAAVVEVGSGTCTFPYPAANLELPPPSLPATSP